MLHKHFFEAHIFVSPTCTFHLPLPPSSVPRVSLQAPGPYMQHDGMPVRFGLPGAETDPVRTGRRAERTGACRPSQGGDHRNRMPLRLRLPRHSIFALTVDPIHYSHVPNRGHGSKKIYTAQKEQHFVDNRVTAVRPRHGGFQYLALCNEKL